MSALNHPNADLSKGQYGCVGQACILPNACCLTFHRMPGFYWFHAVVVVRHSPRRGGDIQRVHRSQSGFGSLGCGKPLYQDLILRTKAALQKNPKNMLLAVCWMQGEFDMSAATYSQQPPLFTAMLKQFVRTLPSLTRSVMEAERQVCHGFVVTRRITGKTPTARSTTPFTGRTKNRESDNVFFVPFLTDVVVQQYLHQRTNGRSGCCK
ncbi:hypothetical protein EH63_17450 [Escherichia coli]|nr:hypothetical protein EH63_17450 [Escherichia coli]